MAQERLLTARYVPGTAPSPFPAPPHFSPTSPDRQVLGLATVSLVEKQAKWPRQERWHWVCSRRCCCAGDSILVFEPCWVRAPEASQSVGTVLVTHCAVRAGRGCVSVSPLSFVTCQFAHCSSRVKQLI